MLNFQWSPIEEVTDITTLNDCHSFLLAVLVKYFGSVEENAEVRLGYPFLNKDGSSYHDGIDQIKITHFAPKPPHMLDDKVGWESYMPTVSDYYLVSYEYEFAVNRQCREVDILYYDTERRLWLEEPFSNRHEPFNRHVIAWQPLPCLPKEVAHVV
jgi:hypothetical protein